MDPGTLANHLAIGRATANTIRAGLGLPPVGTPAVATPAAPGTVPPAAPAAPPGLLGGGARAPPAMAAGAGVGEVWVAIEEAGGRKKGDVICEDPHPLPAGHIVLGDRAIVPGVAGESGCFVKKVPRAELGRYALDDLRILPVVFDAQGTRRRDFNDAVSAMKDGIPQGGGLQLDGPTSSLNLLKSMRDQNLTPTTYHEYWLRSAEIPKGDRSTYEHECLSRILESMITVDQLNICALQGAELICRRLQVIREAHRISPSSPDYSSADHFMGWRWRRTAQGIDMQLASHVAQALKDEAAIAKEARKAREEQSMRRKRPGKGSQETMNTVRPYDRDLASLPGCGDEPIPLTQVMDEHGRELVKDPLAFMMRSSEEWGEMVERGETFQPYMDVRLQANPELYAGFVKDLVDKKMLDFTLKPGDLVTPFFVNKKNKKLRFILDCRGTNRRFRDPPPLALAAGSTWAQLEVDHSQKLFVAQSDIRDYFFSLELPPDLKHLFCLPPIPLQYLAEWGIQAPCDGAEDTRGWVWPRCRVVPMGWSWAMYIAQRVHQHICLEASGLGTSRLLVEGRPAPSLETGEVVLIPYADNLNVAGTCQAAVQRTKDCIVHRLRQHGFRVHEETEASTLAQSLGFLVDGERHCITPIPERWEKVLQAFGWLARRPRVSGKAVERLLGHAVHFAMLRRELLSIFRSLYDFVARSYNRRQRLWASAAKEAKWAQHLFKLCSVNMKRSWSASVTASDASLSGVAVCSRELPLRDVVRHGRIRETWRYVSGRPVKPREVVVDLGDPFEDPGTVKPVQAERSDPYELNFDFPDIEAEVMQKDCWTQCFAIHMQYPEHITLLEGRGVIAAMRHKFRSSQQFGRKRLHFTDNMGVVLLCSKGRSNTFGMLRVCRRLTCLLLATDSFLQVRWVPSERNVADQASRQWEHLRKHAFSPGGAGTEKEDAPYTSTWNPPSRDKVQPDTEKPKAVTSKTADQDPGRSEAEPLAGETRESDPAEVLQATPAKRGEAERALASRQLSAEIRGACAPEPGVQRPPGSRAEKVAAGRADASKGGPKIFRPSQQLGVQKFVLEIFSGCARLSQACSAVGFISIAYDIAYGTACDVLQPAVLHRILRFLHKHQGSIAMVWLGTPCTTWSRARKHDGGPPPLRDDEQNLFGFDDLSFSDKRKIQDGNSLLSVSEQIISTCIALNLCWAIENPWSSRIWLTPYLKQLADRFTLMRIDFCAYHMPWRKATGILFGGPFSLLHLARECVPQHGRCSFSNRKHIVLVGKDSAGQWLTRRAQPYPFHLCHAIANTLTEHR
ncbi:unnamed protein product [Durusdinium trenchii]|uniref:Reverse transcriptase domain-containing protein n=1 Tax=Durusdinium trenchii TaxID=1381693 RepID=A0ABP0JDR0_9DINO